MGYIKYAINSDEQNLNTGKLLYITKSAYGMDWKSFPHSHYFSELFYVVNGEGFFHVEGNSFPVTNGHLVIVNPHVMHTEISSRKNPLEYLVVGIESLSFLFSENQQSYGVFSDSNAYHNLYFMLRQIETEMREKNPHYEKVCQSVLNVMLIHLMRSSDYNLALAPPKNISSECSIVKRYIDAHLNENITLDLLAKLSHLNKFYLSHKFTEEFGISLFNYLLEQRIQCGKEHLHDTDLRISMVAQISGFSSQSYFTKAFKKSTGISPAKYRKLMQQNVKAELKVKNPPEV